MKYKVIGWTDYEDERYDNEPLTFASRHAIVDCIKAHGYRFSGWEHQESLYGCPVLNDGKKRTCTQRGFGSIMAEAHNEGAGGYARYLVMMDKSCLVVPERGVDKAKIENKDSLVQSYSLVVSDEVYARTIETLTLEIDDLIELRYIDTGDTLSLSAIDKQDEFLVVSVDRAKKLTDEQRLYVRLPKYTADEVKEANEIMDKAPIVLSIKLQQKKHT